MATKLRKLRLNRVDLVDRGANPAAHITLFKSAAPIPAPPKGDDPMPEITKADMDKAIADAVAKASADAKTATDAAVTKALADAKADSDAAVAKAKTEADTRIEKAEQEARVEKRARLLKNMQDKVVGVFKCLAMTHEGTADKKSDAEILLDLQEKAPETFTRVEEILTAANETVKTAKLFEEKGVAGSGRHASVAGSAYAEIEKLAAAEVAKDSKLTSASAIAKVCEANPALYAKHVEEHRQRAK